MTDTDAARDADRRARERALAPGRSFIVQAPAGSGKTELLTQRYLRLLGGVERPEEILAITFTQKAAAEMRDRVLAALQAAVAGEQPAAAHRRCTLELATAALARGLEQGFDVLAAPERLKIVTLDAFNRSLASRVPLGAGVAAQAEPVTDTAASELYRQAARRTLDWLHDGDAPDTAAALGLLLHHLDDQHEPWYRGIGELLAVREQWLPLVGVAASDGAALRETLEGALAHLIEAALTAAARLLAPRQRERLLPLLRHAAANLSTAPDNPLAAWLERDDWPDPVATELPAWRELCRLLLTTRPSLRSKVDKRNGFPPTDRGRRDDMVALLAELADVDGLVPALDRIGRLPDAHFDEAHWSVMLALLAVLPLAVAELDTLFEEHGRSDYARIAQAALAALGNDDEPTDLALLLDYRIRHILVDEMQDTSLAQYGLLERLTAGWEDGDGRTLFCVGDPMQSIYRFRQAEVSRFLLAAREGIGGVALEPLQLSVNFRSTAPLTDWCNETFRRLFPAEPDVALGAVTHAPSVSGSDAPAAGGGVEVHPVIGADRAAEAAAVAAVVGAELAAGGSDIAIIAPSRATLTPVAAALRAAAIPYDTLDVDRLADATAIQPLLAIARALSHPADRVAWLGLLRAPWAALDLASLVALAGDDHGATIAEIVADPSRLARLEPRDRARARRVGDEMQRARGDTLATFAERVESVWHRLGGPLALDGPADVANAYRCLDLLQRVSAGEQSVDAAALYAALEQETISAVHPGDVRVRLMTVHRAKGLEFDCVIVPGLGRRGRADTARLLRWATVPGPRGSGAALISLASSRRSSGDDRLHNYLGEIERRKAQYELDRLLYVAATRAKRRLHLFGTANTGADGALQTPPAQTLLSRLWPSVREYYEAGAAALEPAVAAMPTAAAARITGTAALGEVAPGAPPPPPGAGLREAPPVPELEFRWVGALARQVGTTVHEALERLSRCDSPESALAALPAVFRRAGFALAASGLAAPERERVLRQAERLVRRALDDDTGRWILFGEHVRAYSELALTGIVDGELNSVVIDRVFEDGDGTHWIVDYKTGRHEGGDIDAFLDSERERYGAQLARYRAVYRGFSGVEARTALYYPSLARFEEL